MTELKVCVFCGSRAGNDPAYTDAAHAMAHELARRNMQLVFGGGGTGLMGETARTALKLGVPVTGIIPTFLINQETPVEDLSELKVVADMHERKAKMAELSDLFVVLPGGIGTMEEACGMITGNWIGLYNKPVGFLNVNGFFDAFFAFLKDAVNAGFMPKPCYERAIVDSTASGLIDKLLAARLAPELPRNADCFDHK
mgnify:FL=1